MNYNQNYPVYVQDSGYNYEDHYDQQNVVNVETNDGLQVPDSRIYAEGYPNMEQYAVNQVYQDIPQDANVNVQCEEDNVQAGRYYYDNAYHHQHHAHRTRVPKHHLHHMSKYRYHQNQTGYAGCPLTREQAPNQQEYQEGYSDSYGDYRMTQKQQDYSTMWYGDCKGKNMAFNTNKTTRTSGRKYPVTVKTPKYVTRNVTATSLNKKPSALSLPVVTQPDPALFRKKSKTHHTARKTYDQSEPYYPSPPGEEPIYSYSAHQMDSEGDLNRNCALPTFDYNKTATENVQVDDALPLERSNVKSFAKFLKPRVPSSIRAKQEKLAQMKTSMNMLGVPVQPKMKISLDKLLNRLQKCESQLPEEEISEEVSRKIGKKDEDDKKNKLNSFNYEKLSQKTLSPTTEENLQQATSSCLEVKKSSRLTRSLDDHCAIDLHRSKSYIVDLIDKALSKELGTMPRQQSVHHDMNPRRAIETISRHRQGGSKDLCYEVTAALTDSFISNVTAPPAVEAEGIRPTQSDRQVQSDDDNKKKVYNPNYIKQLKQLRWGHIRHIQHEARKLADLEEFLENCGETDF